MQDAVERPKGRHGQAAKCQPMRDGLLAGAAAALARPQLHGHCTVILLANNAPKLELSPLRKFCSPSFWAVSVPSFGRLKSIWQAAGAPTSRTGSLSENLKSTKNVGSNTSSASSFGFTGTFNGKVKCSVSRLSLYSRK